ncbi:sulfatase-like hydrolase/transferase [Lutimaribacter sp. EGI FJ00015]|uniref:Sulfatase-like hydrolase/transferase n=1 Tax=Lutimaribacter degradans TaxID=2945989 RepID=A0ACC5ZYS4_9RHOB|nr:sulfatase-like hydrolase/transferase [Lutimaribacter sp. EGI FJ00013]MCM2563250.1 sulfatase-like hydrolase/transferase [Lutimaribacter sp. EGI FJ00013]MCO0614427.1 sulfatase-like hydrolase/transferase [Lutimaribacter sp. EGI FJ00015]MCO0635972.1 sulfatase-like hydrolase/transferase [Lutimaribacter sp. EGI FJ00014]
MSEPKNILFIMFDQLRWDYLSCYGHERLHTPNIDWLASQGVRFDRAYIQSPICGSSRMSTYTGRYVHSHGASWNAIPLKVGEMTMGDHLRAAGLDCFLVGKTHMRADAEGMARLGLEPDSLIGARVSECGFDVIERDDGMLPEGPDGYYDPDGAKEYNKWLREKGYESDNPWHDFANSGLDADGNVLSGWFLKNAPEPANIAEEDSETPYLTGRGIEFMQNHAAPWCCHLSYIKPHWPYIVPEPYASMYGPEDVKPVIRSDSERQNAHPIFKMFMDTKIGETFSRQDVREAVIPAYMGLIKQVDDQMGRLFDWMRESGRMEDTMIVLTSDHGDFLGDHWMGEKTFFHDTSTKVPLIIYDPSPLADATRGTVSDALVEAIDLAPTFVDVAGQRPAYHILEGESLRPILHGERTETRRDYVICEYDFSATPVAHINNIGVRDAVMFMVADKRWKMIHFEGGYRPMLFDLENDPDELVDLGGSADHADVIAAMYDKLFAWTRRQSQRTTRSEEQLIEMRTKSRGRGVVLGVYDENDTPLELTVKYRGRKAPDMKGGPR